MFPNREVDAVFDAPISDLLQLFAGDLDNRVVGVQHADSRCLPRVDQCEP